MSQVTNLAFFRAAMRPLLEARLMERRDTAARNLKLTRERDECQKWSMEMYDRLL